MSDIRTMGFIARQQYDPGPLGWVVNPFYFARRELLRAMADFFPLLQGRVLDVGCGRKPYRKYVPASLYVGMEVDTPHARRVFQADIYYDGLKFPQRDNEFDGVLCSQVLEHVFSPFDFVGEINRVLKPGGYLLLTVPFVWDEHEQPQDFARYSSFGLRSLLERSGFDVVAEKKTLGDGRVFFQLINAYLYKVTLTRRARLNLLISVIFMAPVSLAGILLGWVLPSNPDFYLDNVVLARKRIGEL